MSRAEFPYGDEAAQFRMRRTLRKLMADAKKLEPKALGFILIGVPWDRAARVSHTLGDVDGAYRLMEALVNQWRDGRVTKVSHDKIPEA